MTVTLEITPDLESQLRHEASKKGLGTQGYILGTLRKHLAAIRRAATPRLDAEEATLLQEINQGLPAETWQHYRELKEKRRAESLTPAEHTELIAFSDQLEEMNARRMERVVQLARLRQTPVDDLMDELGIKSPLYE